MDDEQWPPDLRQHTTQGVTGRTGEHERDSVRCDEATGDRHLVRGIVVLMQHPNHPPQRDPRTSHPQDDEQRTEHHHREDRCQHTTDQRGNVHGAEQVEHSAQVTQLGGVRDANTGQAGADQLSQLAPADIGPAVVVSVTDQGDRPRKQFAPELDPQHLSERQVEQGDEQGKRTIKGHGTSYKVTKP